MGVCESCSSAKLVVVDDGTLHLFPRPVKVSYVLHWIRSHSPDSFISNSDDLDFDAVVSPMSADDALQPGHLYFALPASRLRRCLRAEDMAALAVKASAALGQISGSCLCRRNILECSGEKGSKEVVVERRRGRGKFAAGLSVINE